MADLFLSYAEEDRERAHAVADLLATRGWSVWWDRKIRPGTSFDREIEREIMNARSVVVLWSRSSVESDWVRTEAREGLSRRILVPVMIEKVRMPLEFRGVQAAQFFGAGPSPETTEARTLFSAIESILGGGQAGELLEIRTPDRRTPLSIVQDLLGMGRKRRRSRLATIGAVCGLTMGVIGFIKMNRLDVQPRPGASGLPAETTASHSPMTEGSPPPKGVADPDDGKPRVLRTGSKGHDVAELRVILRALGYLEGRGSDADENAFGPDTQAAVIQFQQDRNLIADGMVGAQLLGEFKRLARNVHRPAAP